MIPAEKARAARKTGSCPPQYSFTPAGAGSRTTAIAEEELAATTAQLSNLPQLGAS